MTTNPNSRITEIAALPESRRIAATIDHAVFLGDSIRYVARASTGKPLLFGETRRQGVAPAEIGAHVSLAFAASDSVLVVDMA